jgi:membrane peptidoglycan carboxypeptidase
VIVGPAGSATTLAEVVRTVGKLGAVLLVTALFVAGSAVALTPAATRFAAAGEGVEEPLFLDSLDQRSLVYDVNGTLLATLYGEQNRAPVPLEEIPLEVRDAIIAVEDEDFYSHEGVNLRATVRALFENVSAGGVEQGGSTITMQVVKNSILGGEQTLERKAREAVLALRLEEELTKDQILERYLNTAYFGNGAYGVEAAAETYWGVGVAELDWGQAALLAALIRNPNNYNPIRFPEIAVERRRLALDRLVDVGHITDEEADLFAFQPLPTEVRRVTPPPDDYFVEQVKQELLDDPSYGLGDTYEERYNALFSGGLRIHTTLDLRMQLLATQARDDVLPGDLSGQFLFRNPQGQEVQGSAVVVTTDVRSGAVLAMLGGPGFDEYRFNIATQDVGRQPGSSFKVFVLAAALESGIVPSDTISGSAPCRIPNPGGTEDPAEINNYGESRGGSGNITTQTSRSSNCAFARLGQVVGLDRVIDVAQRMGISTPLEAVPSMPIGSEEVLPIEMAAAYASLGNDGIYNAPYFIDRVEGVDGELIYEHQPDERRAVSRQSARLATDVLEANVQGGTGTRARVSSQPTAGKTGTAQESRDAWFVGYTPQYATAVWMGATAGQVPMRNVGGISVTGGSYPARIFGLYMNAVLDGSDREEFAESEATRRGRSLRPWYESSSGGTSGRSSGGSRGGSSTTTTTTAGDGGGDGGGGGTPTTGPPPTDPPVPDPPVPPDVGD